MAFNGGTKLSRGMLSSAERVIGALLDGRESGIGRSDCVESSMAGSPEVVQAMNGTAIAGDCSHISTGEEDVCMTLSDWGMLAIADSITVCGKFQATRTRVRD